MSTTYELSVPDKNRIITVTPVSGMPASRTYTVIPVGNLTISRPPSGGTARPPSGGKRGAGTPLVTTSDEDDSGPDSPRSVSQESNRSAMSPGLLHDHDYENIASPGSAASGPTYVRQPGFQHHAHAVAKPKVKKKKSQHQGSTTTTTTITVTSGNSTYSSHTPGTSSSSSSSSPHVISVRGVPLSSSPSSSSQPSTSSHIKKQQQQQEPVPPRSKPKREPLPMRLRSLPQSFFQQPNVPQNISPATQHSYSILPPLLHGSHGSTDADSSDTLADIRPVSPSEEKSSSSKSSSSRVPERKISTANTDLLFKLFENLEKSGNSSAAGTLHSSSYLSHPSIKRGRPKKVSGVTIKPLLNGDDPYLMTSTSEKLFPQLAMEHNAAQGGAGGSSNRGGGQQTLHLVTLREGERSITLPSLSIEQNYPQMLSELVMHI